MGSTYMLLRPFGLYAETPADPLSAGETGSLHLLAVLLAGGRELLHDLVDAEARRLLARRELLEARDPPGDEDLGRHEPENASNQPVVVVDGVVIGALEGIAAEVEDLRHAQIDHRLRPDVEAFRALLLEDSLPVLVAERHEVAVIAPVEHLLARRLPDLTLEEREQVVAIEVDLEGLVTHLVPPEQLLLHVRHAGRR